MDKIYYFAYGSNMCSRRLKHPSRVPSATVVGVGTIDSHKLTFDKRSRKDGSGKCDAEITNNHDNRVYGVIYEVPYNQKHQLDGAEGLGYGYAEKTVEVNMSGQTVEAVMYYATDKDNALHPYHWYKHYVLAGAREHGLPENYIASLENVHSIEDPDAVRAAEEEAILNGN